MSESSPTSSTANHGRGSALLALLRRPELWVGALVFVAGAYFHGSGSWNQNARLDAIFAFAEPGPNQWTFRIDDFLPRPDKNFNTGDWARFGEHYYANKAPGTLLLGALAYLPLQRLEAALGVDLDSPPIASLNAYWINLWVSVLPISVAVAMWFRRLSTQLPTGRASGIALIAFFGTALFPYSTQLWGHTTAAAFIMMAVSVLPGMTAREDAHAWTKVGVFAGAAVCCDFLAVPFVMGVAIVAALRGRREFAGICIGGAGPAIVLLGYQWYSFGNPFALPTSGMNRSFVDEERVLGMFGGLEPEALWQSTFGTYRGLFFQMPVLLPALVGLAVLGKRQRAAPALWLAVGVFTANLLWLATFNGWHGGATVCARYLIVALPLLVTGLAELPPGPLSRWLVSITAAASILNMLAVAAVSPLAPDQLANPLFNETLPRFLSGELHPYVLPVRLTRLHPDFEQWSGVTVWNGGDVFGLSGAWRLAPLVLFASGCVVLLRRIARSQQHD